MVASGRDNLWPVRSVISARHVTLTGAALTFPQIVTGLILPPTVNEFNFKPPFIKLGQNVGLLVGAAFWGVGADIWGRK